MNHTCPRRAENFGRFNGPDDQNLDSYVPGHGIIGQPTGCSYCGSMDPAVFLDVIQNGAYITGTDKGYKVYVKNIPRDGNPDDLRLVSMSSSPSDRLRAYADLTEDERAVVDAEYEGRSRTYPENWREGYYAFIKWGPTVEGKFYPAHLSEEQGWELYWLLRNEKITWTYFRSVYLPGPSDALARGTLDEEYAAYCERRES